MQDDARRTELTVASEPEVPAGTISTGSSSGSGSVSAPGGDGLPSRFVSNVTVNYAAVAAAARLRCC